MDMDMNPTNTNSPGQNLAPGDFGHSQEAWRALVEREVDERVNKLLEEIGLTWPELLDAVTYARRQGWELPL